ncbi:RXT2-like protein [Podospora didyma]|uniref:RXT2-like protein n=1 Tax=Podospora didyma TaxID=330526 RepID=A0AAE0NHA4_9PEZI|nr:RXT2-like protein [Podospora didyma]
MSSFSAHSASATSPPARARDNLNLQRNRPILTPVTNRASTKPAIQVNWIVESFNFDTHSFEDDRTLRPAPRSFNKSLAILPSWAERNCFIAAMATQQQAMIMQTIVAIRKALKRKAYESDSDSSIEHNTNRGYKLKKRARYVREGRLAPPTGPAAYKEIAEHAGYHRAIINRNPSLVDEEGYDLDSDDNEEHIREVMASAMEDDPYSSIRLEQLLAPLTAVTDLPTHPTLSRPFTSKALPELVKQALSLMHKENAALWKAKPLLTKLIGDNTWAPCGIMIQPNDVDLFTNTPSFLRRGTTSSLGLADAIPTTSQKPVLELAQREMVDGTDHAAPSDKTSPLEPGKQDTHEVESENQLEESGSRNGAEEAGTASLKEKPEGAQQANGHPPAGEDDRNGNMPGSSGHEDADMAEAAAGSGSRAGSSAAADPLDLPFIHPLFLPPRSAQPDRDLGLPEPEAEDVRRLLQLYVQKQEEVCRGTKTLYEGLLKADRYRRTVWQWAKAEAHSGANRDMSDGEDWYDREEWGLMEDLKKGEDEVEEDTAQTQKKTRTRR